MQRVAGASGCWKWEPSILQLGGRRAGCRCETATVYYQCWDVRLITSRFETVTALGGAIQMRPRLQRYIDGQSSMHVSPALWLPRDRSCGWT